MTKQIINYDDIKPFEKWKHPILTLRLWLKGYRFKKSNLKDYAILEKMAGSHHQFSRKEGK